MWSCCKWWAGAGLSRVEQDCPRSHKTKMCPASCSKRSCAAQRPTSQPRSRHSRALHKPSSSYRTQTTGQRTCLQGRESPVASPHVRVSPCPLLPLRSHILGKFRTSSQDPQLQTKTEGAACADGQGHECWVREVQKERLYLCWGSLLAGCTRLRRGTALSCRERPWLRAVQDFALLQMLQIVLVCKRPEMSQTSLSSKQNP